MYAEMLDAGYAGRVWIFTHEPGALFWAFVEKSESTEKLRADPDFVRQSWEVRALVYCAPFTSRSVALC